MPPAPDLVHDHLRILRRRCPHVRRALEEVGLPEPRRWQPGFATLIRIIVDQQVSTAAGAAIWTKLARACNGRVTAKRLLALGEPALRACGLSGQKARYALGAAEAVVAGQLNFKHLHAADDDSVRAALTALNGIGPWSADIYLLFAMGRPDVWPVADLALQHGMRLLLKRKERPSLAEMQALAEQWRPYRSGVAVLLWRYYGALVKRTVAPAATRRKTRRQPQVAGRDSAGKR